MPKKFQISKTQVQKIGKTRKVITDKRVDKRLWAVQLCGVIKNLKIAENLGTSEKVVSGWVSAYYNGRIEALMENKFRGNHHRKNFQ